MNHEHDERHHKNDVDERSRDVKAEAKRPENDKNDADDCEHKNEELTLHRSLDIR